MEDSEKKGSAAYLFATTVLAELRQMEVALASVGVSAAQTTVGGSFELWSASLAPGQTAWVYSLEQFRSITELMAYCQTMQARRITVRSVREPWFNNPTVSGSEMLGHLFRLGESIHRRGISSGSLFRSRGSAGARSGLSVEQTSKARRAVELRSTRKLSVVAACRMAGCGVTAYYRYLKAESLQP